MILPLFKHSDAVATSLIVRETTLHFIIVCRLQAFNKRSSSDLPNNLTEYNITLFINAV